MNPETICIITDELGDLKVQTLPPLERYRFLNSLQITLKKDPDLAKHTARAKFHSSLPLLFANAPELLLKVMVRSTGRRPYEIAELERDTLTELMMTIILENNFDKIFEPLR